MAVVGEAETLADALHLRETKAATQTDSVSPHRDGTWTPMCRLVTPEAARHPELLTTLALHLALDPPNHPHPAAIVMSLATGPVSAVVALQADQYLPTDATAEEREGPARTTVTVLDLDPSFPAVSRAHDPPEENAAVSPHRPITMCTVDAPRTQNHPLAHVPARVPDAHLTGLAATAIPVV